MIVLFLLFWCVSLCIAFWAGLETGKDFIRSLDQSVKDHFEGYKS